MLKPWHISLSRSLRPWASCTIARGPFAHKAFGTKSSLQCTVITSSSFKSARNTVSLRAMTTTRDTTLQSDIAKMKTEPDGSFKRAPSSYRNTIQKGGQFEPESDRYHLYVSYACPWATRTLIVRKLKGLEDIIPTTVVSPHMGTHGWPFASVDKFPGADVDPLYNSDHVRDLYLKADPDYGGRFTVPVLWDKKTHKIVNNESSEIIRIFNTAFNDLIPADKAGLDIYPANLRNEIDELNEWIYPDINNGVYRSGFATTQEAYQKAVLEVFAALDKVEKILTGKDYLVAERLTEADVRLWVTIIRFDPVYVGHFKCNIRTIRDGYPAIHSWLRKLYWNNDAFKSSTDFNHIKTHYYWSHPSINPTRIVPVGPIPNIKPLDSV
ncbi:Glutathione S-transferase omega-like 2 [Hypsizygus marmoreus]|uniref:Glutathione S-transferase omega-like 2 n=1 Tax=Hypsizygus marmoreus TaxID=39966 RepID=A0A369KAT5_HYPMA|nr:Glutathione S-transferase omega-like 2 [Hypsizygus marmoreus]